MKPEKEVEFISTLFKEKFNNIFSSNFKGFKKDFTKILKTSKGDTEFEKWFKKLIEKKIISFVEYKKNPKGGPLKVYNLNKDKLLDYLKTFKLYGKIRGIAFLYDL